MRGALCLMAIQYIHHLLYDESSSGGVGNMRA